MNTYAKNLHIGVVSKNDINLDCKITDIAQGWGLYVREWRGRTNNTDGPSLGDVQCGNESLIDMILDWINGTLSFWGKPNGENWKETGVVY